MDAVIEAALGEAGVVAFQLVEGQELLGRVLAWGSSEVLAERVDPSNHGKSLGRYVVPKGAIITVRLSVPVPMAELDLAALG